MGHQLLPFSAWFCFGRTSLSLYFFVFFLRTICHTVFFYKTRVAETIPVLSGCLVLKFCVNFILSFNFLFIFSNLVVAVGNVFLTFFKILLNFFWKHACIDKILQDRSLFQDLGKIFMEGQYSCLF